MKRPVVRTSRAHALPSSSLALARGGVDGVDPTAPSDDAYAGDTSPGKWKGQNTGGTW